MYPVPTIEWTKAMMLLVVKTLLAQDVPHRAILAVIELMEQEVVMLEQDHKQVAATLDQFLMKGVLE